MKLINIGLVIVLLFSFCLISNATDYKKEASTAASKPQLYLDELDLINLILTGTDPGAEIQGLEDSSDTILFSGKNHNTNGSIITGGKYAIGCNIGQCSLDISNVTLEGTNGTIEDNVDYTLNISTMAPFLRKNADTTITEDTLMENTTLGSSSDYQIVYVNNSKLTLSTGFTGYGVLYIEDKNHNEDDYILEMLSNAIWYGVIIINQTGEDKKSKIFLNGTADEEVINVGDFAILAIDSITIGNNLNLNDGNIGVSSQSGSMTVGNNNNFSGSLLANTIVLGNNNNVGGNVYHNVFVHGQHLTIGGGEVTPLTFPVLTLPEFPVFSIGTQNISRDNNVTYTLNPGSYKNISFGNNCTLNLTGGEYNINNITMGNNCQIRYQASTTLNIKQKVVTGNDLILSSSSPGLDASDCVFYVEGSGLSSSTNVFSLGNNPTIYCNVYAPNSNITIGNNINFKGALIAKTIVIGNNAFASIELQSAFGGGNGGAAQNVEIYGSLILRGNEFYIPAEGANINGYYCREVLEKVNTELESRPYNIWFDWKETE